MRCCFLFSVLLFLSASVHGQFTTNRHIEYSKSVSDSFEVYISLPPAYNSNDTCNVVYYCDANLKSGKLVRELLSEGPYKNLSKTIFVGIGHIGNYHALRRRDFTLPVVNGADTLRNNKNYGQAEHFYAFLKTELIPSINAQFRTHPDSNSIIGHSLGGLFVFFCLFQADNLFTRYFALSPSLWVNNFSIYQFNKTVDGFTTSRYLYFAAGSKEKLNRILKGTNDMKQFLSKKQYSNLSYDYDIWQGKAHNSEVPLSLEKILQEKL